MSEPPTSLVALRDRREAAIQRLADAFAADLLTVDQFDERLARAHGATRLDELEALVADLGPSNETALAPLAPRTIDPALEPAAPRIRTLFGSVERHGAWVVPPRLTVSTTFGSAVLDLREARFTAAVTEIDARVAFGNLEVIVPPQLAVDCEASAIFGSAESHAGGAIPDPERPLVRIRGAVTFGSLEVHVRLPGETAGDARRRSRRERKALRAAEQRALPPKSK
jgi:hypothetical protein